MRFANTVEANAYDMALSGTCGRGTIAFDVPLTPLANPIGTCTTGTLNMYVLETFDDFVSPDALRAAVSTISVQYTGGTAEEGWTPVVVEPKTTCASEGYTGTKLAWCKNIGDNGLIGQVLDTWIHRWINRYRDSPDGAQEGGGEEGPAPQENPPA